MVPLFYFEDTSEGIGEVTIFLGLSSDDLKKAGMLDLDSSYKSRKFMRIRI